MAPVTVRAAHPADVAAIVAMLRALAAEQGDPTAIDEVSLTAALFGEVPAARADVAVGDDGGVAGVAVWFPTFSTYLATSGLYLQDLYVLPAERRHGHGRALMMALAARTAGRVEWSVTAGNERAARFYASLGAHPHAGWTTWHWHAPAGGQPSDDRRGAP